MLLSSFGWEVQAQSENKQNKQRINSALLDEIKSIVKAEENSWVLDREREYPIGLSLIANGLGLVWKSNKKQVSVDIGEHETIEKASEIFAEIASGRYITVHVPVKLEKDFADEAMLRTTNLYGGSKINFYFSQGKYTVDIWGREKDARRFAKHILAAVNAR